MKIQCPGAASLAMAKAGALLGITEYELDLEARFIVTHDVSSAKFEIGAEQDRLPRPAGFDIQQYHNSQFALQGNMV